MNVIGLDLETELIEPGVRAPRLVCMAISTENYTTIYNREEALDKFVTLTLENNGFAIHNAQFDMIVIMQEAWEANRHYQIIPLIFRLYEEGRIFCTLTREKLIAIREGNRSFRAAARQFNLGWLAANRLKPPMHLDKTEDSWRLRYGDLMYVPIKAWPDAAIKYAKLDTIAHRKLFISQAKRFPDIEGDLVSPDEIEQTKADLALGLMAAWGIRTDKKKTITYRDKLSHDWKAAQLRLLKHGVMYTGGTKSKPKIVKRMAAIQEHVKDSYEAMGLPVPVTEKGNIKTDSDTLKQSGNPVLLELNEALSGSSDLIKFMPTLLQGVDVPINPYWNVLVDTGRTSCGKPTLQTMPRKPGCRECFKARPGYVFISCDWNMAELCSLAQICYDLIGFSKLGNLLNKDHNPHIALTAQLMGVTYKQAVKWKKAKHKKFTGQNKLVKAANFGFPGGLGSSNFITYAKNYNPDNPIILTEQESKNIQNNWFSLYPEMRSYFNMISDITSAHGSGVIHQHKSGRIRGRVSFTQAANSLFQGLTADGAKRALWEVTKRCYIDEDSSLYDCRPVILLHDEIIIEAPNERASDAGEELSNLMNESMAELIDKVPITSEPVIMKHWFKDAQTIRDNKGRLQLWQPENLV